MKASEWVSSAFDGFDDFGNCSQTEKSSLNEAKTKKRLRENVRCGGGGGAKKKIKVERRCGIADEDLWADKYTPNCQDELAVHKKKIADVEAWLHASCTKKICPILLLTGPAGCGKSATVKVLAKDLDMEIKEWTNPITDVYNNDNYRYEEGFTPSYRWRTTETQKSIFIDFLLRANKYRSLDMTTGGTSDVCMTKHKLILIEEYPNIFFREADLFREILRKYSNNGKCPLVFVISDSAGADSNERLLFPKDIQADLSICNISFNPVAPTMMSKVITRIITKESLEGAHKFPIPSKDTIDAICTASNGDIRGAINAAQFACLKETTDLSSVLVCDNKSSKRTNKSKSRSTKQPGSSKSSEDQLSAIGGKDVSLFLFRALGKILYCKRGNPEEVTDLSSLPKHLSHHYRDPLLFMPEDVVEKSNLSSDLFNAFLHENYMEFFTDIDDVVRATEYMSDSDYLTIEWTSRSVMREYSSSVAARGLMFSNSARSLCSSGTTGLGWKPLHKPQWFSVIRKMREQLASAKVLFRGSYWTPDELTTQFLPFLSKTDFHHQSQMKRSFLKIIGSFSFEQRKGTKDRLDEKDLAIQEEEETKIFSIGEPTNNVEQNSECVYDDDNVVIIDDFDD
ncbi:cell cycle checkpoint protein RAD17-like [Tubulanus polymorphus]|uniref:cell cycle checkpoint protein RAD17-like n=1 Tax=Tubulanus polymorphus TaxID=672921 RepID=UPI003DA220F3